MEVVEGVEDGDGLAHYCTPYTCLHVVTLTGIVFTVHVIFLCASHGNISLLVYTFTCYYLTMNAQRSCTFMNAKAIPIMFRGVAAVL